MCIRDSAGPHLMSTGKVKAVKLTSCTGAYWRGDSKSKMLQRVYGISFPKASELTAHPVSYTHLDVYKRQVMDMLVPVSPSGTGKIFNSSTEVLCLAILFAPDIMALRRQVPLIKISTPLVLSL